MRLPVGTVLVGLLVGWGLLLGMRLLTAPDPQHRSLTYVSGQRVSAAAAQGTAGIPAVRHPSRRAPLSFREPKNIFAISTVPREPSKQSLSQPSMKPAISLAQPAKPAPLPEPARPMVPVPSLPPPPPVTARPVLLPPPTPPPAIPPTKPAGQEARLWEEAALARQHMGDYRFLGYVTQGGQRRAFVGKGSEIYITGVGEMVEGTIVVKLMDATSVTLLDQTTHAEHTLHLVKEPGRTTPGAP